MDRYVLSVEIVQTAAVGVPKPIVTAIGQSTNDIAGNYHQVDPILAQPVPFDQQEDEAALNNFQQFEDDSKYLEQWANEMQSFAQYPEDEEDAEQDQVMDWDDEDLDEYDEDEALDYLANTVDLRVTDSGDFLAEPLDLDV